MADYSKMTDEQVNEAIFKAKGYTKSRSAFDEEIMWLKPIEGEAYTFDCRYDIPDYTHSWELCGKLLEEMMTADVSLMYFKTLNKWGVDWVDNDGVEHQVVADTPKRAICEARLAWEEHG